MASVVNNSNYKYNLEIKEWPTTYHLFFLHRMPPHRCMHTPPSSFVAASPLSLAPFSIAYHSILACIQLHIILHPPPLHTSSLYGEVHEKYGG